MEDRNRTENSCGLLFGVIIVSGLLRSYLKSRYREEKRGKSDSRRFEVLLHFSENRCELNWSAQHLREVYSQEFRNLRFFSGVDLGAAL